MTDIETEIRDEYQTRWSDPKRIHRTDKNLVLGWHFGYYEKGVKSRKRAIINMNNYVDRLLEIEDNTFRILDAGCGVGATVIHLAKKHPGSIFFGITLSSNEIQLAEKLKRSNNLKNTNFHQKSYNNTDFPDDYFDSIYALETVNYAEDKSVFLKEMNRILKKGSKLVVIDVFKKNDLTDPFIINIRQKILKEKKYEKAIKTIDVFKKLLIDNCFKNIQIFDLVKSKNVKFHHMIFFMIYYLFETMRFNTQEEIRQKTRKKLFFRFKFFYFFIFRSLLLIISRPSYFSIVGTKNNKIKKRKS